MATKKTLEDFLAKARSVHGDRYDYSLVEYKQTHQKVAIVCPLHGKFDQSPNSHCNSKQGCPECAKDTRIKTSLKKYGVEHPHQSSIIKEKKKQTMMGRWGVDNPSRSSVTQKKKKQTMEDRYGCHSSQQGILSILPMLNDYNWLFNQYIIENKTGKQIAEELGVDGTTISRHLLVHEIEIKKHFWGSYKCQLWLQQQQCNIVTEWKIPGTKYRADGYCESTNTIYEFHGDYWHGNPSIFEANEMNEVVNKSMGDLYQKTITRENLIRSLGYNLVVMWESEFNQLL